MTQKEMIIKYIKEVGSITPLDAIREFGCTKLATRVSELKKDGWQIKTHRETSNNRFGKKVSYARYTMKGPENDNRTSTL